MKEIQNHIEALKVILLQNPIKSLITGFFVITAILHVMFPKLAIDSIAVVLLFVAALPWLLPLIKSFEAPGGWKIELRDIKKIELRAEGAGLLPQQPLNPEGALFQSAAPSSETYMFQELAEKDPNLALASLRIEIEKRLRKIAEQNQILTDRISVGGLLGVLNTRNLISQEARSVLSDMIHLLNGAVHGAEVDKNAAQWAIGFGPRLLASLDERARI